MELSSGKVPRFVLNQSAGIDGAEHQMSVAVDLQGWFEGPFQFKEAAVLDLLSACRAFMAAQIEGETVADTPTFSIQQSWIENVGGVESVLEA